jgi:hypothetical protein
MSDLISRQAVLDGIAEWIVNGYADSEADCSHISSLVTHLPSVENKGEWIPVSERLPEEGTHILVSVRGEPDFVATDDYYSYGFDDWKDDVTAWQPLPEPYKGESEEV